jgi:hypothetical protein
MTKARPEHADGRRKLPDATREKLREAGRRQYAAADPDARARQLANLEKGRQARRAGGAPPDPLSSTPPPPAAGEGRRSPFAMTPRELLRSLRNGQRGDPGPTT